MKKIVPFLTLLVGILGFNTAQAQCMADFSFYTNGNGTFVFADSSGNRYTSDDWTFGDGNSTSGNSGQVTHRYNRTGSFTVCRMVWDSANSCRDTFCTRITYTTSTCKAEFKSTISGDTVQFRDASNGAVYYSWDFGDNKTSTAANPQHIYSKSGTYRVCLTIDDSSRTCIDTYCASVTIGSSCDATWVGSFQRLTGTFRIVNYKQTRVDYRWSFGNGDTTKTHNPTYTYAKPGAYVVCLEMYDSNLQCSDYYCDSISVDTSNNTGCRAFFSAAVSNDTVVQLTNWSQGFTNFKWYFPNGNTSSNRHESIVIKTPGTYTICLFAEDSVSGCQDSVCQTVTIDSARGGRGCQAAFRVAVDTSQKFKLFLINSSSNKSSHSYYWSFGDGGSSTKRNPTHKYNSFGRYLVCLTITDSALNCTSTYCDSLGLDSTGRLLKADGFELEVIEDFASTPKIKAVDCNLYPNPTTNVFTVKLEENASLDAALTVYNLQGRLVAQSGFDGSQQSVIDLQGELDGLYIVRIFDGENFVQTKIVKISK